MVAVKGIIRGNTVIVDAAAVREYQGKAALVTIIDEIVESEKNTSINLDIFVKPTERGKNADIYLKGLRGDDRI